MAATPEDGVPAQLRAVITRLGRILNSSSTIRGLTPTEASVLGVVATRGPMAISELVALEGLNPTMVSRMVTKLERDGLLSRTPDANDARAVRLSATSLGADAHGQLREVRTTTVARSMELLPDTIRATLLIALPALEQLAEALQEVKEKHPEI
jgi:DNA-binding MarR family transcriptional regulator